MIMFCNEVAKGVSKVNDQTNVPVIFGILTTESIEQAVEEQVRKLAIKVPKQQ